MAEESKASESEYDQYNDTESVSFRMDTSTPASKPKTVE